MECKEETESFCRSPLAQRPWVDQSESFFKKGSLMGIDSVFGCCFPFSIPCFVLIYPQPNPLDLRPTGKQLSLHKPGQHCRLSICEYWLSWTNTVSEQEIPITILSLKRGPCLHELGRAQLLFCKQCHDISSEISCFRSNAYHAGNYY